MVLALSSAFVLMGVVGFVHPNLFGLIPNGLGLTDDMLHLALGTAGLVSVEHSRRPTREK